MDINKSACLSSEQTDLFCRSIGEVTDIVERKCIPFLIEMGIVSSSTRGDCQLRENREQHGLF